MKFCNLPVQELVDSDKSFAIHEQLSKVQDHLRWYRVIQVSYSDIKSFPRSELAVKADLAGMS